jgi:3-oxoacyl-[acyl-carrier protein] reductase
VNVDSLLVRAQDHDIQQMIGTNIAGALYLSRAACKTMMRRRRGVIINIGSIAATQSNAGQVVYATTKAALVGLTKGLAKEMAPKGIRVNLVSPGFVATDMTKHLVQDPPAKQQTDNDRVSIRRVGSVEEVAQVINKVITHETLTGEELFVDGSGELIL